MFTGYRVGTMRAPLRDLTFQNKIWPILRLEYAYAENTRLVGGLTWGKPCHLSLNVLEDFLLQFFSA